MLTDVTYVIPSIPPRRPLLHRALASIDAQTIPAAGISIAFDNDREGAGPTRTRAMDGVGTTWTAFVDDDDELYPHHAETLLAHVADTDADVVWGWFDVVGGGDPIPGNRGKQWDPDTPHTFPITALVRTALAQQCHFPAPLVGAGCAGEDFNFWMQMSNLGAVFSHLDVVTWIWHHDSYNTGGMPDKW